MVLRTDESLSSDAAPGHKKMLAPLPGLLSYAREVVISAFEPGDPEADALRALLEECVIGAHRLVLRERTRETDRQTQRRVEPRPDPGAPLS